VQCQKRKKFYFAKMYHASVDIHMYDFVLYKEGSYVDSSESRVFHKSTVDYLYLDNKSFFGVKSHTTDMLDCLLNYELIDIPMQAELTNVYTLHSVNKDFHNLQSKHQILLATKIYSADKEWIITTDKQF